jgi:hypothetical protein
MATKEKTALPLSKEERIVEFLSDKQDFVKLNDFLKSLYPVPKTNEPAQYLNLPDNKLLRKLLETMQAEGRIEIRNNAHRRLAERFYEGEQQVQRFHNLNTILIEAKNQ